MTVQEWPARKVREWLLAILRFAVTLDDADRTIVEAIAIEMDRLGPQAGPPKFAFFARASAEFCGAISNQSDPNSAALLHRHLARIDDHRLRRALEAALECEQRVTRKIKKRDNSDLWKGLTGTPG